MTYDEIKSTVEEWQSMLPPRMRKYIHYRSMRNFMLHFNEIGSERDRAKILTILEEYVQCVQSNDYSFDRHSSPELATSYLFPLIDLYRDNSTRFMRVIKLQEALMLGFLVDSILYLSHVLSGLHYIPITTVTLLSYYVFLLIFKIPSGRVYGMFY
jgi:hypothetical protein